MSDDDPKRGQHPTMPGYHTPKVDEEVDGHASVAPEGLLSEPSGELNLSAFDGSSGKQTANELPPNRAAARPEAANPPGPAAAQSSGAAALSSGAALSPQVQASDIRGSDHRNYVKTPLVEIEVVHEHGPAPRTERPWRTLEIWTRNRIYTMDPTMLCVDVVDRLSNKAVPEHSFIGSRLVGGQHRQGERIELSSPFPRPGTEAVFEHAHGRRGNFSRTSTVTRVILRLHVVTVAPSYVVPTWETITGSVRVTPPTHPPPASE